MVYTSYFPFVFVDVQKRLFIKSIILCSIHHFCM